MSYIYVFKIIYLIISIPLLILINVINHIENMEIIISIAITNYYILKDTIEDEKYRKYKTKNPEPKKRYLLILVASLLTFIIPKLLFNPIIEISDKYEFNFLIGLSIIISYLVFTLILMVFNYNLVKQMHINKSLNPFKHRNDITYEDLIVGEIKKINKYQKIITGKNRIIIINNSGIYEIINFVGNGILTGDINDQTLKYNDKVIQNPFLLKGENIYNYFIINTLTINVTGVELVMRNNIYNMLEGKMKNIYTNEEIDKIYKELYNKYVK